MQYEPAAIQASDNPPSREISYKSILNKVCILTQLLRVWWFGQTKYCRLDILVFGTSVLYHHLQINCGTNSASYPIDYWECQLFSLG
jgi:hypothetical protein